MMCDHIKKHRMYIYLQTENARAVPTTAVLRRMRLFVVRAAVEITICDITKHRIRHFITSLLIVSSAYDLQFFFQNKNYKISFRSHSYKNGNRNKWNIAILLLLATRVVLDLSTNLIRSNPTQCKVQENVILHPDPCCSFAQGLIVCMDLLLYYITYWFT